MNTGTLRHGGLVVLVAATPLLGVVPPPEHQIPKIQSRRFEIAYQVNETALPLTRVVLWYSRDGGDTWHNYGADEDRQSPITFDAAEEGLYGFYFVLENRLGTSGEPPQPGTAPQQWAFVDYTPPIVQLHPVQVDARNAPRPRLQIRWTAIDAHFGPRPIELSYRLAPDGEWMSLGDLLSNTGRYDWAPPESLQGRVLVRLTVRDRSGHRVSAVSQAVEVSSSAPPAKGAGDVTTSRPADPAPTTADPPRAEALFRKGLVHKERGEYRLAAARFQEALALQPNMTEALVNLGETLYFREQNGDAIEAYEWAVKLEPAWAEARRGLVRVLMAAGRFEEASNHLLRILKDAPQDTEGWLSLGDAARARGDELAAREYWQKAATLDPTARSVVERAQSRLAALREGVVAGAARK